MPKVTRFSAKAFNQADQILEVFTPSLESSFDISKYNLNMLPTMSRASLFVDSQAITISQYQLESSSGKQLEGCLSLPLTHSSWINLSYSQYDIFIWVILIKSGHHEYIKYERSYFICSNIYSFSFLWLLYVVHIYRIKAVR